jgi:hypothetical protein
MERGERAIVGETWEQQSNGFEKEIVFGGIVCLPQPPLMSRTSSSEGSKL